MERYSEYKDSGVYFLPRLPKEWKIRKAKYLFNEEYRPTRPDDEIVTCFRDGQVTLRKNRRIEGFTNSLKEIGYQGVRKGDLVIHNMDAFAGSIGVSDSDGKATPVYSCCTPKSDEVNQYYYCLLLRCLARNGFILSLAKGIRERSTDFRFNDFKELYLPLPSRREQDAIVAYLDKVTSKIDAAIAQQQKMIELLNERKQIIINNAVTKGLDPTAKMKPSGIPWLGNIPAHWRTVPIKRYISVKTGKTPSTTNKNFFDGGTINWFTPGDIMTTKLCASDRKVTQKAIKEDTCPLFPPYTVYLVGIGGTIGKVAYSEKEASCNQQINALIPNEKYVHYKYLALFIHTSTVQIYQNANLSTLPIINQERTGSLLLSLPSITEQKNIVKYIETKTQPIVNYIQRVKEKMELLQERKQIIINDVVTGKVKVI